MTKKFISVALITLAGLSLNLWMDICLADAGEKDARSTTGPVPPESVLERDREEAKRLKSLSSEEKMQILFTQHTIPDVPEYFWRHGCGPTAVSMVVGYYDTHGYDDLISGDASTQINAVDQAIASGGDFANPNPPGSERHYEDCASPEDDAIDGIGNDTGPLDDDYITKGRTAHTDDCIADYMRTSRSNHPYGHLYYGWSYADDIERSFIYYVNQQNPSYTPYCKQYNWSATTLWSVLVNEIDNGRPMVFLVDCDGDGSTDHFVPVVGYDDSNSSHQYAYYTTWSEMPGIRWSTFQSMTNGKPWGIWGGWSFSLVLTPPVLIDYQSSSTTGQYWVTWLFSSGATSYQLERSSNGGSSWSQVYSGSGTSYLENVGNGSYRYRVQSINAGGPSDWTTGTWDCEVLLSLLSPPDSIDYPSNNTTGQYTVSWLSSEEATSYQLERSSNGGSNWSQVYSGSNTFYTENIGDGDYRYRVQATNAGGSSDWTTGTWDCEVILPPLPPGSARNPSPPIGEVDVSPTVILTWTRGDYVAPYATGGGGNGHHVFFSTKQSSVTGAATSYPMGTAQGHFRSTSASFDPNHCIKSASGTYGQAGYGYPLPRETTFYWCVIEVNNANTGSPWKSPTWNFTTTTGKAANPSPDNGTTGVNTIADLSWTAGSGATSHDVYFGTTGPGEFKGNQTATTYDPCTLAYNTTYYWRIDEKSAGGTITGIVWNFTTATGAGDFDGNGREDFADFAVFASAWMSRPGQTNWNPACDISKPKDDIVDWRDLVVFVKEWLVGIE